MLPLQDIQSGREVRGNTLSEPHATTDDKTIALQVYLSNLSIKFTICHHYKIIQSGREVRGDTLSEPHATTDDKTIAL